jgi:hypothetical protein
MEYPNSDNGLEPLSILQDNVFKAVFTKDTEASRGALRYLLSAITEQNLEIIDLMANEPAIDDIHDRQIRYDIHCKIRETQEQIDVEMTIYPDVLEELRLEFLASKLFCSQDIRGRDRDYSDLKRAYQISILANNKFLSDKPVFEDKEYLHTFEYYDAEHHISLGGQIRIITLELNKLEVVLPKGVSGMTVRERWGVYFKYHEDREKEGIIKEILEQEEGIQMAQEAYSSITQDERERSRLMSEWKFQMDFQSKMVSAERAFRRERAEKEQALAEKEQERAEKEQALERAEKAERELAELRRQLPAN